MNLRWHPISIEENVKTKIKRAYRNLNKRYSSDPTRPTYVFTWRQVQFDRSFLSGKFRHVSGGGCWGLLIYSFHNVTRDMMVNLRLTNQLVSFHQIKWRSDTWKILKHVELCAGRSAPLKGRMVCWVVVSYVWLKQRGVRWEFAKNTRTLCWEMRVMAVDVAIKNRESLARTQRCGIGTSPNQRSENSFKDNEWASACSGSSLSISFCSVSQSSTPPMQSIFLLGLGLPPELKDICGLDFLTTGTAQANGSVENSSTSLGEPTISKRTSLTAFMEKQEIITRA